MESIKVFRHEYKFIIRKDEMLKIRDKLKDVLNVDRNIDGYMVRSLYFDSVDDIDYFDKLSGECSRKKVRLRIYNYDTDKVKLEIKRKEDIHQLKSSVVITRDIALKLIDQDYGVLLDYKDNELANYYQILRSGLYSPKCIIEYDRIAFVSKLNTRITFDYNIKSTNDIECFFDKDIDYSNISMGDSVVMEVKFDLFLEPFINKILSNYVSMNKSVSKYILGRNKVL